MKKDSKQRLFEVMGRLDSTFKPKLNEDEDFDANQEPSYGFNPEEHPDTTQNDEIPIKWTLPREHPSFEYFDHNDILSANHAGYQSNWDINKAIEYAMHNSDDKSVEFLNHIKNTQQNKTSIN